MHQGARWSGEDVLITSTSLGRAADIPPSFRRVPLAVDLRGEGRLRRLAGWFGKGGSPVSHKYLDAVLASPRSSGDLEVPIAIVSKQYSLIPHRELVAALLCGLSEHFSDAGELDCDVALSEYGGRMRLKAYLPSAFKAPDGEDIEPTLECWNSVDRSRPLQIYLGWFRFICENGLILGEEFSRIHRRHIRSLELKDVRDSVADAVGRMARDAEVLQGWWATPVSRKALRDWVDGPVAETWGVQAAARVLHIAKSGHDCQVLGAAPKVPASGQRIEQTAPVPGSTPPNGNAYRVSQVLSYVAGRRNEVEAIQRRLADVPSLIKALQDLHAGGRNQRDPNGRCAFPEPT